MTATLPPRTTSAAEGLLRRRFTVAEIEKMTAAGILAKGERTELIGGDLVMMSAKGIRHERLKTALMVTWARKLPEDVLFTTETTFRLSEDTFLEPDFVFYPRNPGLSGLRGDTALLVVEIADSSLDFDLGRKATIYAAFAVTELWVIDAVSLRTRIHLQPTPTGYASAADCPATERLVPARVPAVAVTLAELELG